MLVCSRNPAHRNLGEQYCQEEGCGAEVCFLSDQEPAISAPATSLAASRDRAPPGTTGNVAPPPVRRRELPIIGFRPLEFDPPADESRASHTTPPPTVPPPPLARPETPDGAQSRPSDPVKRDVRSPQSAARRTALLSIIRGASVGTILGVVVIVAIVELPLLFKSPSDSPVPRTRSSQASVTAGSSPVVGNEAAVVQPQSGVTPPQTAVNEPAPRATATAVLSQNPARGDLVKLHARAVRREQEAASFYTLAKPVLRSPQASVLRRQADAALAGVRGATDRIADYAAAIDRTAPRQLGALLHNAEVADRDGVAENRRLHAVVGRARGSAKAPAPLALPPSTGQAASMLVETATPGAQRATPPAPLSEDDRRRYTAAMRSYRRADDCYRDIVRDVSRAYGTGPADAERNRDLGGRVRVLYERLQALHGTLGALAGANARSSSTLQPFDLEIRDYLAQCRATHKAIKDRNR